MRYIAMQWLERASLIQKGVDCLRHLNQQLYQVLLLLLYISVTATIAYSSETGINTDTILVSKAHWPHLLDDLALQRLPETIEQQLRASKTTGNMILGQTHYSAAHLQRSAIRLLELARTAQRCVQDSKHTRERDSCQPDFAKAIQHEFLIYTNREPALLTAYYTPTIDVATTQNAEYRYPIYGLPQSLKLRQTSRRDIDFHQALAGHDLELYYARDRFDIFLLHVEGGGKLRIHTPHASTSPTYQYLSYAGDNGKPFHLLEEYMLQHKMLQPNNLSRFAQRHYLLHHPQQAEAVYASCPNYVFFTPTATTPAGNSGIPLTPDRSLAVDPHFYPVAGLIAYISARIPLLPDADIALDSNPHRQRYRTLQRFFISQDEGPYIKGSARFDLYFGEDNHAFFLANNLHTHGTVYFLVLK